MDSKKITSQKNVIYRRFIVEKLMKTWLLQEPAYRWFDNCEVFQILGPTKKEGGITMEKNYVSNLL